MIKDIEKYVDKYKKPDIMLNIRDDKILAYKNGDFIFDAHKLGDFWYIKIDKGVDNETIQNLQQQKVV